MDTAATEYYTVQEERISRPPQNPGVAYDSSNSDEDEFRPEDRSEYVPERQPFGGGGRGRTLGNEGDPTPAASRPLRGEQSKPQPKNKPLKTFATLGDFSGAAQNHGSEDDDDDEKQDLFAGGEKSGLAVQNPDDIKKKILERAKKYVAISVDVYQC